MSYVLSADDIAELRGLDAELASPDAYRVLRVAEVPDGRGGRTTNEAPVEAGHGELVESGLQPDERETAGRLGWSVAYVVKLPYDTLATPKDRIRINAARTFEVGGVLRAGNAGINARAVVREVG